MAWQRFNETAAAQSSVQEPGGRSSHRLIAERKSQGWDVDGVNYKNVNVKSSPTLNFKTLHVIYSSLTPRFRCDRVEMWRSTFQTAKLIFHVLQMSCNLCASLSLNIKNTRVAFFFLPFFPIRESRFNLKIRGKYMQKMWKESVLLAFDYVTESAEIKN